MDKIKATIPYYEDINEFIASIPMDSRTSDLFFYCLRLNKSEVSSYKPPFRRGFYFVGLLTNAEKTKITYDNTSVINLDSLTGISISWISVQFLPGQYNPRIPYLF